MDNQRLLDAARTAAANAYAPYSNFAVGAAVLLTNASVVTGVNVESVSYGLTICAERAAVSAVVSQGQQKNIEAIAVWASKNKHGSVTPCGACRQVLAEFAGPDLKIITASAQTGEAEATTLGCLLPSAFTSL